jgi:hypothetical protein
MREERFFWGARVCSICPFSGRFPGEMYSQPGNQRVNKAVLIKLVWKIRHLPTAISTP